VGGLYIHIPFCRQACRYCDFYFTVSLKYQDEFVEALLLELEKRSAQYKGWEMGSLYLGGGTPSLLSYGNLMRIMEGVQRLYKISPEAEITFECNPDDLMPGRLQELKNAGINRLSIGIQSFVEQELQLMRRSHNAAQAVKSVEDAAIAGFKNTTVDLIYGIPGQTEEGWIQNISRALTLPVTHLSAYHLTYEPGTVFDHWRKKGKIVPVTDELSEKMYKILRLKLEESGFEHYEISNFAREGARSRHNQLYWSGDAYLGFGPSAHSFEGSQRSWNVSSLKDYMAGIAADLPINEYESLSNKEQYHDYLITTLRTTRGADPEFIRMQFGKELGDHFDDRSSRFITAGDMLYIGKRLVIDQERWLMADHIMRELFKA
jgi:oxygen-independent coproporphyrinogen-3 oxidase